MREIYVIGDIEMGAATLTDDFIADRALSNFILSLAKSPHAIDLILNGDTFDFLKVPLDEGNYPFRISPQISLAKLNLSYKAHEDVFKALKLFLKEKTHRLYFTFGNHDHELIFSLVQEHLKKLLGCEDRVIFTLEYEKDGVYIEHSHQYDLFNRVDYENPFRKYGDGEVLHLPWGFFGMLTHFVKLKEEHPFLERIFPRGSLLSLHGDLLKKTKKITIRYALRSMYYYPFRALLKLPFAFPNGMIKELFKHVKRNFHKKSKGWMPPLAFSLFKETYPEKFERNSVFVFSHFHGVMEEKTVKKHLVHPGSWRDEYDLEGDELVPRKKRYVKISFNEEKKPQAQLLVWPTMRSNINFYELINDEKKFLELAAKEEGYKSMRNSLPRS